MWTLGPDAIMGLMLGGPADPAWAQAGVAPAAAAVWELLGVTPDQARRLGAAGREPLAVVAEWWRAGVPLDEVASWLTAGLSAAEAVQQRAEGVTPEQARAFAALQGLGAPGES
ncbi:MAG TPA: hypothetical protein VGD03_14615 [Frankiaceae bacterium]